MIKDISSNRMSEELKRIEELERRLAKYENIEDSKSKSFSSVSAEYLDNLGIIEQNYMEENKFDFWFNNNLDISNDDSMLLNKLLNRYGMLLNKFNEDRLKVVFIGQILEQINFFNKELKIGNFYHSPLSFKNDKINFNGFCDFYVARGIDIPKETYFFIQEFKQEKGATEPEPQLVAELISAVELNKQTIIKGAYIKGILWRFVILEKLGKDKYQYFVSKSFDSTNIQELKKIFKNLLFIKNEIIEIVKKENK